MYIHKMGVITYNAAVAELIRTGHKEPLQAHYVIDFCINGSTYRISMQPSRRCKIAVLQAVHITTDDTGAESYELLTTPGLLNSLFSIWLSPFARKKKG